MTQQIKVISVTRHKGETNTYSAFVKLDKGKFTSINTNEEFYSHFVDSYLDAIIEDDEDDITFNFGE